jgi:hypothetical protein
MRPREWREGDKASNPGLGGCFPPLAVPKREVPGKRDRAVREGGEHWSNRGAALRIDECSREPNQVFPNQRGNMKLKHALLVLAGIFCMSVPVLADTFSPPGPPDSVDSFRYSDPVRFDIYYPSPQYQLAFDFQKRWEWRDRHQDRNASESPAYSTPEPSALMLLASGMIALLGAARLKSLWQLRSAS